MTEPIPAPDTPSDPLDQALKRMGDWDYPLPQQATDRNFVDNPIEAIFSEDLLTDSPPIRDRDKPAFPANLDAIEWGMQGLTKREYATIHQLRGLFSNSSNSQTDDEMVDFAIAMTDILFDRLEQTNDPN